MTDKVIVIHTNEELQIASHYFRYHIRMYVETLLWLQDHPAFGGWNTLRNAILEDHLVHARILINFLSKRTKHDREDDVLAEDYFHDIPNIFEPLQDSFLNQQAQAIGGQAVHITKKPMPKLRSQKEWPTRDIAAKLTFAIKLFLKVVPETRLADDAKQDCLTYLEKLTPPELPVSLHSST
jgi:hypothetical protein